jgi:hypothetical protein
MWPMAVSCCISCASEFKMSQWLVRWITTFVQDDVARWLVLLLRDTRFVGLSRVDAVVFDCGLEL